MKYFYYDFTHRSWQDYIRLADKKIGTAWDLINYDNRYLINLGNKISRQQLYHKDMIFDDDKDMKIIGKVFGKKTLELIHWMVSQYLTSYKSIISLFITDLWQYIKQLDKNKIKKTKPDHINFISSKYKPIVHPDDQIWQTLVLMPDIITIASTIKDRDHVLIWQDWHSKVMKYMIEISTWQRNLLITTHGNIRMNWKNLTNIIIFYPETRYYKNQLDPRYDAVEVCHKLANIYNADIKIVW